MAGIHRGRGLSGADTVDATTAVTIIDSVPISRVGLEHALAAAGFEIRHADGDPTKAADAADAVVISVRSATELRTVRTLATADPSRPCVALVEDSTPNTVATALRVGASACLSWTAPVQDIVESVRECLAGRTVLSTETVRWMAARLPSSQHVDVLPPEDVERLRLLSTGMTVATLADRAGYSERTMYRLLQDLYARMRVDNRRAAVSLAHEWGLLP